MSRNMRPRELSPGRLQAIEERMRNPKFPGAAFLGKAEGLIETSDRDLATLDRLNLNPDDLASGLKGLKTAFVGEFNRVGAYSKAEYRDRGLRVLEQGDLAVAGIIYPTFPEFCPFDPGLRATGWSPVTGVAMEVVPQDDHKACAGQGDLGYWDFYVENTKRNIAFLFGDLAVHLIGDHHFFEGRITRYRVDPLRTAFALGLITESVYEREKPNPLPPDFWSSE
jgi:hypothetical protein